MVLKRVGIIGATSPLGVCLVGSLRRSGYNILAGYRWPQHVPAWWCQSNSITCVRADVEEPEAWESAFKGCGIIVWLAYLQQGCLDERELDRNLQPLERFCRRASAFGVDKVVFVSSGGAVYGEPFVVPVPEDHPRNPLSSYGRAKREMEDIVRREGDRFGFATAILRPGNIYGPEWLSERGKGVIAAFFRSHWLKQPLALFGDGGAVRDFVHGDDVTRAILCAMKTERRHVIWNVGTSVGSTVLDIQRLVGHALGDTEPSVVQHAARIADPTINILAIDRIRAECGWYPEIGIVQGIGRLAKHALSSTTFGTSTARTTIA